MNSINMNKFNQNHIIKINYKENQKNENFGKKQLKNIKK
jgi:hypothetical protein